VKFFESIEHKVAILCVAGLYWTGKSFLLNLLTNSNAFSVDSTTDACTRGFNFCNKPITLEKNGEIIELYIIDSEGLGGVDKS